MFNNPTFFIFICGFGLFLFWLLSVWFAYKVGERRGYSESMASSLLADLKPLLKKTPRSKSKPYDKLDVFYYLDENIITTKREQFLNALESFKNKF